MNTISKKRIIGPKLFQWQRDVVNAIMEAGTHAQKIFVCKSKRQTGKSFMCEMELLRHSIMYANSTSICVSLTYTNCEKIFKELATFIMDAPFVEKINASSLEINFKNKSSIIFKSAASGDNLRGLTVTGSGILILDECAYLKDEIFGIVLPYVNMYKCNVLMVSTPRTKTGVFYEYFKEGLNNKDGSIISIDWSKYDTSEVLSNERIELFRKILPKYQFISEILGEFVDELGGVFDLSKNVFVKNEIANDDLFVGIDWATGKDNDYTCVTAIDSSGVQYDLNYTNTLNPTEQIQWITNIIKTKYQGKKIHKIICEENSIGTVYIADLKKSLGRKYQIESFTTSNTSKRDIIEYMIKRVNEETVKFVSDKEMYVELGGYQVELTKRGVITYNGMEGIHDDLVMASAFALYGIKKMEREIIKIAFITGKEENDIWNLNINDFRRLQVESLWMQNFEIDEKVKFKTIKIDGDEYIIDTNLQNFTIAQYIDFQMFYGKRQDIKTIGNLLACIIIPKGKKYADGYDIQDVVNKINDNLDILTANEIMFFFLKNYLISMRVTANYFNWLMKRMMKKTKDQKAIMKLKKEWEQMKKDTLIGLRSLTMLDN